MRVTINLLLCLCTSLLFAQNEDDMLRLMQTDLHGSARTDGMAGSFGALGADISTMQINPGGMGRYSSSQFGMSLHNNYTESVGIYNDSSSSINSNDVSIGTFGFVLTGDASRENKGRVFRQFTFSYNRLKNFNMQRRYEGQNFNSLLDVFANSGSGIPIEEISNARPFSTEIGLNTDAIFYDSDNFSYYPNLTNGDMYHEREINASGGLGEFHLGYSENYMNKLYWGISLGIRNVNYSHKITHTETLLEPNALPEWSTLESFTYEQELEVKGRGYNFKGGFLYLPKEELRFGFAFESPTFHNLSETFMATMTAYHEHEVLTVPEELIPFSEFGYRVRTPMKLRGSLAYIFDLRGAINFDVELMHYGRGRFGAHPSGIYGSYDFEFENELISDLFRPVANIRVGGELLVTQHIYLRGGLGWLPNPFKRSVVDDLSANKTYALGIGWERDKINIDLAYRNLVRFEDYYAFDPSDISNRSVFENNSHIITLSINYRF